MHREEITVWCFWSDAYQFSVFSELNLFSGLCFWTAQPEQDAGARNMISRFNMDLIALISLSFSVLVMLICLWQCEVIVLFLLTQTIVRFSLWIGDVLFLELFHTSFPPFSLSFFHFDTIASLSSHPAWQPFQNGEAPGQFPLPSFAGCHVVYSAQLFKKCWISTMAFTGALSTFVWSNLGSMRWVPEQGELSCSVHRHTTDCPALWLFYISLQRWELLLLSSEWLCKRPRLQAVDVSAIFQRTAPLLGLLTASCWRCVSQRGIWRQQQDQSVGECPQFCGQSGRRLGGKRGEEREGAFREMLQGALCCFEFCLLSSSLCGSSISLTSLTLRELFISKDSSCHLLGGQSYRSDSPKQQEKKKTWLPKTISTPPTISKLLHL